MTFIAELYIPSECRVCQEPIEAADIEEATLIAERLCDDETELVNVVSFAS